MRLPKRNEIGKTRTPPKIPNSENVENGKQNDKKKDREERKTGQGNEAVLHLLAMCGKIDVNRNIKMALY